MDTDENEETHEVEPADAARMADALASDDLKGVAWAWLAQLSRTLNTEDANRAVAWARILEKLGAPDGETKQGLLEASVLGGVIHGFAPRTAEQWEFAESVFDAETLNDIRTWTPSTPEGLVDGASPPGDAT